MSTFDLEPNPFEQSFASKPSVISIVNKPSADDVTTTVTTNNPSNSKNAGITVADSTSNYNEKKNNYNNKVAITSSSANTSSALEATNSLINTGSTVNNIENQDLGPASSAPLVSNSPNPISVSTTNASSNTNILAPVIDSTNNTNVSNQNDVSDILLHGASVITNNTTNNNNSRPIINSPSLLTPGGSRKLPLPISNNSPGMGSAVASGILNPSSSTLTPSTFFFSLTQGKNILTPNIESSIRTGLTPAILYGASNTATTNNNAHNNTMTSSLTKVFPTTQEVLTKQQILFENNSSTNNGINATGNIPIMSGIMNTANPNKNNTNTDNRTGIESILGLPIATSSHTGLTPQLNNTIKNVATKATAAAISTVNASSNKVAEMKLEVPKNKRKRSRASSTSSITQQKVNGTVNKNKKSKKSENYDLNINKNVTVESKVKKESKDNIEVPDEKEKKRREFLERNRLAASKFRRRKKEYIKKIERHLDFYKNEYNDITENFMKHLITVPHSAGCNAASENTASTASLIDLLKNAVISKDTQYSLGIIQEIEAAFMKTGYYQRAGVDPTVLEKEDEDYYDEEEQRDKKI
ncbi:Sko1p SCDLUD_002955 [Saccharomycodes ludwigii]|uniref:Sko1p n=1 Tax=Saccharomycodes ludwigii TaxID=36035 RepID=UPI001E857E42|nr:hypothetical protein SCDLUD_002955 [Saccharomycodes ludwigii]KAH3901460.1 hypothetical protein SCDLUD_002955 [Saccharomycodes ludwigii]